MKTGAEKVLEWFRKYSEQNGTPTPFEIRCQLELAIDEEKLELKNLRLDAVSQQRELLKAFSEWSYKKERYEKVTTHEEDVEDFLESL